MQDLKALVRNHFLQYASYVILDRAIPSAIDGLKPVQRRILYTLFRMHDGRMHKVANVVGQTMMLHPHGDAPIAEAMVSLVNKLFLIEGQGNFGNPLTGDPAAASRYIEARLTPLALETLFNKDLTEFISSYDGRHEEPITLPAKIPFLLLQGAEGIAVGMSTRIFPHNFVEVLEAEIACLENKPYQLIPDFPTGGLIDPFAYDDGRGKVQLRALIEIADAKTLVIREICYGTTTESLIRSIEEAAKKGHFKIDSIHDYSTDSVHIEIKLPRGVYAHDLVDALYHFTECAVVQHSQITVIEEDRPCEPTLTEIIQSHCQRLLEYFRKELEIEKKRLEAKIYYKMLEAIFIENNLYKDLEKVGKEADFKTTLKKSINPYLKELERPPTEEELVKLLEIPVRRLSRFDREKMQSEVEGMQKELKQVKKNLSSLTGYAISFLKNLIKKYGKEFPRKTKITTFHEIEKRRVEEKKISIKIDESKGFLGTKVEGKEISCTNFDKIILFYSDGTYFVTTPKEKQYIGKEKATIVHAGVLDKKQAFSAVYKDLGTYFPYAKRFTVERFMLDKPYSFLPEGVQLVSFASGDENEFEIQFIRRPRQKVAKKAFSISSIPIKGVGAKGIRLASKPMKTLVKRDAGK